MTILGFWGLGFYVQIKPAQGLGVAINWGDIIHGMAAPVKRIPQSQKIKTAGFSNSQPFFDD
jgi:hypothetical protein